MKSVKLDKNTFGKTKSAIRLAEILNEEYSLSERHHVAGKIDTHKKAFKQLASAHKGGHISRDIVCTFINLSRKQIKEDQYTMITEHYYAPIVASLYANVIITDFKRFTRDEDYSHQKQ